MADLPPHLDGIKGLRFTIYADDITLWTKGGSIGEQEQAMQQGLNTITSFLTEVGLAPSPEKTVFVVLAKKRLHKQNIKSQFKLTINGVPIKERPTVRILGLDIDEDGGATTWLKKLTATWKSTISLIRRITSKNRTVARIRAGARDLRQLARILIIRCVPGHNGIPGNEEAHKAARERLSNRDNCQKPPSRPTNVFPALKASTPPSLELLPDESEEEGYDYEEAIAKARYFEKIRSFEAGVTFTAA
ncbi:uncharacterized protein LOC144164800 [Haemaphysalis longicornis]